MKINPPSKKGNLVEETYLEFRDSYSQKYYRVKLYDDGTVHTTWGRIGSSGQALWYDTGRSEYNKHISAKVTKGYKVIKSNSPGWAVNSTGPFTGISGQVYQMGNQRTVTMSADGGVTYGMPNVPPSWDHVWELEPMFSVGSTVTPEYVAVESDEVKGSDYRRITKITYTYPDSPSGRPLKNPLVITANGSRAMLEIEAMGLKLPLTLSHHSKRHPKYKEQDVEREKR